jgi:hypothetical protein
VVNVEEEDCWHIGDAVKAKGFKGGRKYDIRERIFYFTVKTIPIPKLEIEIKRISKNNRETL